MAALAFALLMASCSSGPEKAPVIGEAFAGPEEVIFHKDIDARSAPAGSARHGDRLELLAQRRRWFQVRNERGLEGWVDDRQLLDTAQMNRLRTLAKESRDAPSQGVATTFDTLNVHTEPNRLSPSFLRIKAGEKFDVILHRVVVKGPMPKRQLVPPRPKAEKSARKKAKEPSVALPPPPAAPTPPADWLQLSRGRGPTLEPESAVAPVRDDWTLIRTAGERTGWVLSSRLYMNIPDEVAQYAEGHRITSYASVGKISDHGDLKDIWLWTTAETLGLDYDFDSYRVFTWSTKRHRYETAFIQRRERGYFPVRATDGSFSVCLDGKDGNRVRRKFKMVDTSVRPAGSEPCEAQADTEMAAVESSVIQLREKAVVKSGLSDRMVSTVKGWLGRK